MKAFMDNLLAVQKYMTDQRYIKTVSVAQNGAVIIVYDAEFVSEGDAHRRMEECGIANYSTSLDWRSNSVF